MTSIGKVVGGALGLSGSTPKIKAPQFSGITTPSLSLSPTGTLTRTDQLVPQMEQNLFNSLAANQQGILGQLPGIQALQSKVDPLLQRTSGFFDRTAGLTNTLTNQLSQLQPGFGRITQARVQGVKSAASQAVGNLRSSFQKRDIAGASFANQQIAQVQKDFANQEDQVRAESFIQEYQTQQQIVNSIGDLLKLDQASLQQQAGTIALALGLDQAQGQVFAQNLANIQSQLAVTQGRISRELNELGVAGNIINQVNAIASQVATAQAKLEADAAAAQGQSFANLSSGIGGTIAGYAIGGPLGATLGSQAFQNLQMNQALTKYLNNGGSLTGSVPSLSLGGNPVATPTPIQ